MKRIFRRNQIIITTLAVMIAAAGYLNYSAKMEAGDGDVYEAGMMEISDEDILAENQAGTASDDGSLTEIASLDGDGEELLPGAERSWRTQGKTPEVWRKQGWKIPGKRFSPAAPAFRNT